ncbi:YciI family protein [Devosia sp. Root635]|uniref:YciI family protein n=1 Tax=Devosia sp. Root635 TaxID=1736575 RepID=UPI0006F32D1C|nr:YciI family protein [Devosia sp. Root635]KRA42562.1 hypothetical protein ASD80_08930 [Devosia sp. Root635]
MKFLCLAYFGPDAFAGYTPEQMRAVDDATIAHDHKLRQSGHLLFASPLADVASGTTIDRRRLKLSLVDGPYAETKEVVGGFILVEARDMAEAVSLFDDDPIAAHCRLEIRPLIEDHRHSETGEARPEFRLP